MANHEGYDIPIYSSAARKFHWWVAALILVQLPIGFYMTYRGTEMMGVNEKGEPVKGVWDGLTDLLYNSHKAIGLMLLLLVVLRLGYRLSHGAPPSDRSVPAALTGVGHLVHWGLYLALIVVPVIGYIGISYGRYLDVFGLPLPAVTGEDKKMSEELFEWHEMAAFVLIGLALAHIAGAIFHKFVRKDRVVERMLPKRIV